VNALATAALQMRFNEHQQPTPWILHREKFYSIYYYLFIILLGTEVKVDSKSNIVK